MAKLNFATLSDDAIKQYDRATTHATDRAAREPGECYSVYWDGAHSFAVQNSAAAPPKHGHWSASPKDMTRNTYNCASLAHIANGGTCNGYLNARQMAKGLIRYHASK